MESEKTNNFLPNATQRNFIHPTNNTSQESITTHDKETEKALPIEPDEEEEEYNDAAPSPYIARGPSETANHREVAVNKYNELQRVVSQRSQAADADQEIEYPTSVKLVLITVALCLCVFCVALDNTIIATAIPRITDQFHALDDVGWYGSAYLLCTAAFQLFFGKLYNFFSVKWVYLIALLIFEIGSAVCGAAPTSNALIVGRAIAGLGAAGLFSGSILIVSYTVPLAKRPMYVGCIGGMYGIASVVGPLLGGAFTDHLTWRWCFFINLPIGAISFIFVLFFFKDPARAQVTLTWKEKAALMDFEGTIIFVPAIVSVLLALQWGGSKYAWSDGKIIALFVVFAVLILIWIGIQFYKGERATLPPRILRQRSVAGACAFSAFIGGSFFAIVYYVPIWFQAIQGASAVESGIRNLPLVLSVSVFSIISGVVVTTSGYYNPMLFLSTVLASVGAGLLSTFQVHTPHQKWIAYQFLYGAGVGIGLQNPLIVIQNCLSPADHPTGTAAVIFFQTFGGALLISVAQNVFQNQLIANLRTYVPDINPETVISTGATSIATTISQEFLPRVLVAYNRALDQTFYVAVAMAALSIFGAVVVEWRSIKGKKIEMGGGA